jgi:hypothetical protein
LEPDADFYTFEGADFYPFRVKGPPEVVASR